jgi:DNA polymerase epsilon subunit 4
MPPSSSPLQPYVTISGSCRGILTENQEMFIQHLAEESHTQAKVDTKPRRNIQYKDVANAVARQDNLEFLEDVVPKTVPYKAIKNTSKNAAAPSSKAAEDRPATANGTAGSGPVQEAPSIVNGDAAFAVRPPTRERVVVEEQQDPSEQLELEMRQAHGGGGQGRDGDVHMTG